MNKKATVVLLVFPVYLSNTIIHYTKNSYYEEFALWRIRIMKNSHYEEFVLRRILRIYCIFFGSIYLLSENQTCNSLWIT